LCFDAGCNNSYENNFSNKLNIKNMSEIAENVKAIIDQQVEKGISKYGQTLDLNDDTIINRINHFQEEMADGLQYAEWIKQALFELKTSLKKVRDAASKEGYLRALDDLDKLDPNLVTFTNALRLHIIETEIDKIQNQ
jgi:hypothetical protein